MKIFWIVAVTVAVVVPGLRADATAEQWKVLKSRFVSFTMEYPDSWSVHYDNDRFSDEKVRELGLLPIRIEGPQSETIHSGRHGFFSIDCFRSCDGKETAVFTPKGIYHKMRGRGGITHFEREVTFGGEPAYDVGTFSKPEGRAAPGMETSYSRCIYLLHQRKGLQICASEWGPGAGEVHSEADWKYRRELERMMKSFRFL